MVKVTAEITLDALTDKGRVVGIRVNSDDVFINNLLGAPFMFQDTYPINLPNQAVTTKFKQDISAIIRGAKNRIRDDSLRGKKLEFDV